MRENKDSKDQETESESANMEAEGVLGRGDWVWDYGKEKVQKDEDKLSFNNILEESVRYIDRKL